MTLTLAQARTIVDKTLAAAREKKLKPLGVAVVDGRGGLRAYAEEAIRSCDRESHPARHSDLLRSGRGPADCTRSASSARIWQRHWWR